MRDVTLRDAFWLRKYIFETGKYVSEATAINPSPKCITRAYSNNVNKINFALNSQNEHFCKAVPKS